MATGGRKNAELWQKRALAFSIERRMMA